MASVLLEDRVAALEAEVAHLKTSLDATIPAEPQWKRIVGIFANDPAFKEAMRLGREYRDSLRPPARKGRNRKNDRA
jgi:hypothetical protein